MAMNGPQVVPWPTADRVAGTTNLDISKDSKGLAMDSSLGLKNTFVVVITKNAVTPTGTLYVEVSNNTNTLYSGGATQQGYTNGGPAAADASWSPMPATFDGTLAVGGNLAISQEGNHVIQVEGIWRWIRLRWAKSTGAGGLGAMYVGAGAP